jgi:hypothetical protein
MPKSNPPPRIYFNPHAPITEDVVSRILNYYCKCDDNNNSSNNKHDHKNKKLLTTVKSPFS